jgi:hypothetical protein
VRQLLLCLALLAPSARALPSAVDVARRYADAVVRVARPCPTTTTACTAVSAQGFFVSSAGMLVSVLPGVVRGDVVEVTDGGSTRRGRVDAVDDDGLALVQIEPAPDAPVTALAVAERAGAGRWLIGLHRDDRGVQAVVGGEERDNRLLVPVPRGAPVLDERLEVVAIARRSRGGGSIDALPVARLHALAKRAAEAAIDAVAASP